MNNDLIGKKVRAKLDCTEFGMTFFRAGDVGVVEEVRPSGDTWVNFNSQGNAIVLGDGVWCVAEQDASLYLEFIDDPAPIPIADAAFYEAELDKANREVERLKALLNGRALTFDAVRAVNVERCEKSFFPLNSWSASDWACALAGEAGEACNAVKKLNRGDGTVEAVAKELADTVHYCDLLAARLGIDLGAVVASKFNEVSARVGSDIRLPASAVPHADPFRKQVIDTLEAMGIPHLMISGAETLEALSGLLAAAKAAPISQSSSAEVILRPILDLYRKGERGLPTYAELMRSLDSALPQAPAHYVESINIDQVGPTC